MSHERPLESPTYFRLIRRPDFGPCDKLAFSTKTLAMQYMDTTRQRVDPTKSRCLYLDFDFNFNFDIPAGVVHQLPYTPTVATAILSYTPLQRRPYYMGFQTHKTAFTFKSFLSLRALLILSAFHPHYALARISQHCTYNACYSSHFKGVQEMSFHLGYGIMWRELRGFFFPFPFSFTIWTPSSKLHFAEASLVLAMALYY